MLRIYQQLSSWISSVMSTHEKGVFTTGARILAAGCAILAIILVQRCSSQLF